MPDIELITNNYMNYEFDTGFKMHGIYTPNTTGISSEDSSVEEMEHIEYDEETESDNSVDYIEYDEETESDNSSDIPNLAYYEDDEALEHTLEYDDENHIVIENVD